jgi:hypothetical protein
MQPSSLSVTLAAKRCCAAPAPIAPALTLAADARLLGNTEKRDDDDETMCD